MIPSVLGKKPADLHWARSKNERPFRPWPASCGTIFGIFSGWETLFRKLYVPAHALSPGASLFAASARS